MYLSLCVLAIVFLAVSAGWVWLRRRMNSTVSDLEGQITLLKLRLQDVEEELACLREELKQKNLLDG